MLLLTVTLGLVVLGTVVLLWLGQVHPYAGPFNKTYKILVGKEKRSMKSRSIVTINTWNLPFRKARIVNLMRILAKNYPNSIILLQELWSRPNMDMFPEGTTFVCTQNSACSQISAGLAVIVPSDLSVRRSQCVSYSRSGHSWDQFAAKGILIVELDSCFIVNTHMQSNDAKHFESADRATKSVWLDQYRELVKVLQSLDDSKPIIVGGDFNRDIHNFVIPGFLVQEYPFDVHTHSTQGQIDGFFARNCSLGSPFYDPTFQSAKDTDHVLVGHETSGLHF